MRYAQWKLTLSASLQLFDLEADPGPNQPVRTAAIHRKQRGMAILLQEEIHAIR